MHAYAVRGPGGWYNVDSGTYGSILTASFWSSEEGAIETAKDLRERWDYLGFRAQRVDFDISDV